MNKKFKWTIESYQDEDDKWVPKAVVVIEEDDGSQTIPLQVKNFTYDEKEDADNHAEYLAKDYVAKNL